MSQQLMLYDAARNALAQARTIDEVKDWEDKAAAVREYARRAKNRDLEIDAAEIRVRAQRRRGELLAEMRAQGRLADGPMNRSSGDDRLRMTLDELGTTKNESSHDQKLAAIGPDAFERLAARCRARMAEEEKLHSFDVLRERDGPINGARAVMGSRQEPDDSLDYFPTPPIATRALIERVLPRLGIDFRLDDQIIACDPACGEGHITGVLEEYVAHAVGSDVFDYSVDSAHPPGWLGRFDFLADPWPERFGPVDWIITNPPFEEKALSFVLRALALARRGVAVFVQLRWLETIDRYEQLFRDCPPTLCAWFVERIALCKGRWDPDGSTATAYMWMVWAPWRPGDGDVAWMLPQAPYWIPPDCKATLSRPTDRERFTAHPVAPLPPPYDPETGEIIEPPSVHPRASGDPGESIEGTEDVPSPPSGRFAAVSPARGEREESRAKAASDASTPPMDSGGDGKCPVDAAAASRLPAGRTAGTGGGDANGAPAIECTEAASSGEPSPEAGPQAEASHAGTGSGPPAGHAADREGGGANALATSVINLDLPPSLRRVTLSREESARATSLHFIADRLELNARVFLRRLINDPASATELDRQYLARIAAKHLSAAAAGEAA